MWREALGRDFSFHDARLTDLRIDSDRLVFSLDCIAEHHYREEFFREYRPPIDEVDLVFGGVEQLCGVFNPRDFAVAHLMDDDTYGESGYRLSFTAEVEGKKGELIQQSYFVVEFHAKYFDVCAHK